MIGQEAICARPDCLLPFVKVTHNQKYCTGECCKIQTNRKIMENYHEKAAIKRGKKRVCQRCEVTVLSRYNQNSLCAACEKEEKELNKGQAAQMVSSVMWL